MRGEVWAHKTSLTLPLFIEMPVPSQESEQSCMCVIGSVFATVSTVFQLNFGTVQTMWYFFFNIQLTLIVSNSVDSNFRLSRIFIKVPKFVVYKYI